MAESIDTASLQESLQQLGLKAGMKVIVHSSLKSLGYVEGGPDAVIDALMAVLTPEGTLLMPSFNHNQIYSQGGIFDLSRTPTLNGIIPDTFWRRPGVYRSLNPTHAFAAWGRDARRYTRDHHNVVSMGRKSPLGLLYAEGGYALLLGVGYESNTFHHFVETDLASPCLSPCGEVYPVKSETGAIIQVHTWGWREAACPINDAALYGQVMACENKHCQKKIGNATSTLYRLQEGYEVISRLLQEGYAGHPPCSQCPIRPRQSPYAVDSIAPEEV